VNQINGSISSNELEAFVRRVVREEIARLLHAPVRSILIAQSQEGPDDPAGDELLLREALAVLQEYGDKPEAWMDWEDFEAELRQNVVQGIALLNGGRKQFWMLTNHSIQIIAISLRFKQSAALCCWLNVNTDLL
jgi:hypothetical protein